MIVAQCVLVAALVLVHSTSLLAMPNTTAMVTSTATTSTTEQNVTLSTTTSPTTTSEDISGPAITDNTTTENAGMTTDQLATFSNNTSTSVESIATVTKPKLTNETNMLSLLNNDFVFTSTWIIVIAVGGFTLLTAMPLLIIMILIVALGCVCKKYKRMKKRLIAPAETVASNDYREMTTAMNSNVVLRNIVILDGIDTGTNVAYGRTSTVVESCDIRKNTMTTQNTEADGQNNKSNNNIVMTGDNVAYGRMSVLVEGTAGCDDMATQDDTEEADGDADYVINDMYDSIDT